MPQASLLILWTPTTEDSTEGAEGMLAAWTILQDVGTGFFGTEIPTATVTTMAAVDNADTADVDESTTLDCYDGTPTVTSIMSTDDANPAYRCGLIPERHDNTITTPATDDDPAVYSHDPL